MINPHKKSEEEVLSIFDTFMLGHPWIPYNDSYSGSFDSFDVINKFSTYEGGTFSKTKKEIVDRIYTLYAAGNADIIYILPDYEEIERKIILNKSYEVDASPLPNTNNLITKYAKGAIINIKKKDNGYEFVPRRLRLHCEYLKEERNLCAAITKKGVPCKKYAIPGGEFCNIHLRSSKT